MYTVHRTKDSSAVGIFISRGRWDSKAGRAAGGGGYRQLGSLGGFGGQHWEAALLVPLAVPQAPHSLHLRLKGTPLVPVSEVTRL